jgi:hypothetical protein
MTDKRRAEIAERVDGALKFSSGEISDMMLDMNAGDGQPGLQNCERLCVQARLALEVPWLLAELSRLTDQIAVQNLTNASQAKELIGLYEDRERLTTALTEQAKRFAEREAIYKNQIEGGAQRITALTAALAAREEVDWEHWHKLVDAIPDYEWPSANIHGEWKKSDKVSFVERVVRDHMAALAARPGVGQKETEK